MVKIVKSNNYSICPAKHFFRVVHSKFFSTKFMGNHNEMVKEIIYPQRQHEWEQELLSLRAGFITKATRNHSVIAMRLLNKGEHFLCVKKYLLKSGLEAKEIEESIELVMRYSKVGPDFFEYCYNNNPKNFPKNMYEDMAVTLHRIRVENNFFERNSLCNEHQKKNKIVSQIKEEERSL